MSANICLYVCCWHKADIGLVGLNVFKGLKEVIR